VVEDSARTLGDGYYGDAPWWFRNGRDRCGYGELNKIKGDKMERVCFLLKVRGDKLTEYRQRHKAVWPEMLAALGETGWHNYSLFLRQDGLLVGYFETPDYRKALEGMANREINLRWQREMAPFFEDLEGRRPDEGLLRLEEIFHLA
jgi:L-rhamnose mutarotase